MEQNQTTTLSVVVAYAFGAAHDLQDEVDEIRNMVIKWNSSYTSSVRRGYIVDLFEKHGIFEEFKARHWAYGNTSAGKTLTQRFLRIKQDYEGGRPASTLAATRKTASKPKGLVKKTPEQLAAEIKFFKEEGRKMEQSLSRRERDPRVRKAALLKYGPTCIVCGLDPAEKYGDFAPDCVEVHHLEPLSAMTRQEKQTTLDDVTVVCPTCHRAIHRYSDPSAWKQFQKECGLRWRHSA